ncbi:L,D-transpeptidase [Roseobacter sp. HKCCA0434]|uniref:L,D-transpeptidase family protein n=1 Tax=Roseobacter sp. HKCCA0434 TaxID=3079297 RepID=UPI0029057E42|nr:L,D-transpeptidase family protein [Roseobacter sp. HKCCA0434]
MSDLVVTRWDARFAGRRFARAIGKGGFTSDKREGDGATPVGAHRLVGGMWRADRLARPETILPLRPAGPRDIWSDDVDHAGYNHLGRAGEGTFRHERMRRGDPLYDIVLFSDWNWPEAERGRGSAIFVHCWRGVRVPTAGCVAFARADLLWILARWQPGSRLVVQP